MDVIDRALCMPSAARYLLERCGLVGWLQQAACAANSLDVDVFVAPERQGPGQGPGQGQGQGQDAGAMCDDGDGAAEGGEEAPEEEEDGEAEGGGGSDGDGPAAAAAAPAAATAAGAGKTARAPRVRARAGLLAAPPRLLHRLVSLLRRALGAAYLLGADQAGLGGGGAALSALLQQVALAATALLDDVAAVDSVGLGHLLPQEYLRQLVLLLWDVAVVHGSSGGAADADAPAGLPWGAARVAALAAVWLRAGGGDGDADADGDVLPVPARAEAAVAALSLLGFVSAGAGPRSGERQGPVSTTAGDLVTLLTGASFLYLWGGEAVPDGLAVVAACPHTKAGGGAGADYYRTAVHMLAQDCAPGTIGGGGGWAVRRVGGAGEGLGYAWTRLSRAPPPLAQLVNESWTAFGRANLDATALPSSLGARVVLSLTAAAVARAVPEPDDTGAPEDGDAAEAALAVVRWAVAVHAALRPLPAEGSDAVARESESEGEGSGRAAVARRVLCAADGWRLPAEAYSRAFCAQQLAARLAAAAAASAPSAAGVAPLLSGADGRALLAALARSAAALRGQDAANDAPGRGGAAQAVAEELSGLVLDVTAALVTAADRRATAGDASLRLGDAAARLSTLCAQLPPATAAGAGAGVARGAAALAGTLVGGLFEAAPSREGSATLTLRANCAALFDRAAATWRGGRAGARAQVEVSMAAAQAAPLVGMAAGGGGGVEDGEDDGDDEEEEEVEEDDGLIDVVADDADD